ncbi:unnamed protein product [Rotaria socialis]|uniref:FLYWCH-type domain-containing protein n=1 Tax=Rotaria socialis TaxID=392032 RepID=A0A821XBL2_9BILA|nr:unnamed protein product [Rotaria socialis]
MYKIMLQHKQRPRLDLDGFSYVRDRITSDKIYWRCIKYKSDHCHGRLHTCLESKTILKHPSDHICKFDAPENQVRQFSQQVTARALNTQENPDSLGHQAQYQTDSTFAHNIHKIAALAFHDPNSALNGFESLCERLDDQYDNILDYFEETYIDKLRSNLVRRKPLFEVNF